MFDEEEYEQRANAGETEAMKALALREARRGNNDAAREWYQRAIALGDAYAMSGLGWQYRLEGDPEAARHLLEQAADLGNEYALFSLGVIALAGPDTKVLELIDEASATDKLSSTDERALRGRAGNGDIEARARLVIASLPIVAAAARHAGENALQADVMRHGIATLLEGTRSFDNRHDVEFAAYMLPGIRGAYGRRGARNQSAQALLDNLWIIIDGQRTFDIALGVDVGDLNEVRRWWEQGAAHGGEYTTAALARLDWEITGLP